MQQRQTQDPVHYPSGQLSNYATADMTHGQQQQQQGGMYGGVPQYGMDPYGGMQGMMHMGGMPGMGMGQMMTQQPPPMYAQQPTQPPSRAPPPSQVASAPSAPSSSASAPPAVMASQPSAPQSLIPSAPDLESEDEGELSLGMLESQQAPQMMSQMSQQMSGEVIQETEQTEAVHFLQRYIPHNLSEQHHKFEIKSSRVLCCKLARRESIWCKLGSMISYVGNVTFAKQDIFNALGSKLRQKITRSDISLMKCLAKAESQVFISANGGKVIPIFLKRGESIVVDKDAILAFESSISHTVFLHKSLASWIHSGMFKGPGFVAVTCQYDPIVMQVTHGQRIRTDYKNTVFWSGNLSPGFRMNVTVRSIVGAKSLEEYQMNWTCKAGQTGFVGVSPVESVKKQKKPKGAAATAAAAAASAAGGEAGAGE